MKLKVLQLITEMSKFILYGITIQFFFITLLIASDLRGQEVTSIREVFLSVSHEDAGLLEVFDDIEKQTRFKFAYDYAAIERQVKINLKQKNISVADLLMEVSREAKLKFRQVNNYINVDRREINEVPKIEVIIQGRTITGKVISSEDGEGLPGVNVVVEGTTTGSVTDIDGVYSVEVNNEHAVLVFSSVGYVAEKIAVGNQSVIDVQMVPDITALEELVVVGYGTQKKVNLTGAVGTVDSEVMESRPVANVQELLQGKTPGLNVTNNSGAPGSGAEINIRGTSTIGESSDVLVIIDGVPGNIYTLNPNDIKSVSVLKDAASAAIYGSRAANGVLLITTKEGNKSKGLQVSLTSNIGIQNPLHFIDFVGAKDFMESYNIARVNEGASPEYTDEDFDKLRNGELPDHVWYKEMFEKNQIISTNHLTLSGKKDEFEYNFSTSFDTQSGALPKNDYKRFILKPDITFNATKWLSLRANVQYTQTRIEEPQGGQVNLTLATRIAPIIPIYNEDGTHFGPGGIPGGNPKARIEQGGRDLDEYKEALAIFSANITPLKNWRIIPLYSLRTFDLYEHNYTKPITLYNPDGTIYSQDVLANMTIYNSQRYRESSILQLTTDYTLSLDQTHNFTFLLGANRELNKNRWFWASRKDPGFEGIYVLDIGAGIKDNGSSNSNNGNNPDGHDAISSVFGRINYDYKEKYLIEANIRGDGSSRFSDGYRWGWFPSVSAGWNIARENFLAGSATISNFKFRASYGTLGDAAKVGRYETRNILTYSAKAYAFDGSVVPGAFSNSSFDPEITWEKAIMRNVGLDMGLFEDRLNFTLEYFINTREDILYNDPNVPFEYGLDPPVINGLKMDSKGIEGLVSYTYLSQGGLRLTIDANASYSQNKVTDLKDGPQFFIEDDRYTEVGSRYEAFYGLESDGLFQSQEDIDNSASQSNVLPGNIKYKDQLTVDTDNDGIPDEADGVIDGDDRVVLDDSFPVRYGFNLTASYKNFDFSANIYGVANNRRYIQGYEGWPFFISNNLRPMHLDNWREDNKDAAFPRITTNMVANDTQTSDFWLRRASYLKIQGIQLGYTLPNTILDRWGIDYLRVYLSGQNLAIFSNYDGFDPEGGNYPLPRTATLGLQLKF
ncbi:MAG: TonB-dependent receptor [Cytophagales bacterium]|nr:TonB-dependent receptor [Cytophagales bacterium]